LIPPYSLLYIIPILASSRAFSPLPTEARYLVATIDRSVAENIEEIRDAGIELYNRTTILLKHFSGIGVGLKNSVSHYNNAVSSLESRFIPQARKLFTLGSAYTRNLVPDIDQVELAVRQLEVPNEEENSEKVEL
jgi:DNA recombination protein RmuC